MQEGGEALKMDAGPAQNVQASDDVSKAAAATSSSSASARRCCAPDGQENGQEPNSTGFVSDARLASLSGSATRGVPLSDHLRVRSDRSSLRAFFFTTPT